MTDNVYQAPQAPLARESSEIPAAAVAQLCGTQPWAGITGILGIIMTAVNFSLMAWMMNVAGSMTGPKVAGFTIAALIGGYIALHPLIRLCKYATAIRRFKVSNSMEDFENALRQQWLFWRFVGVLAVILLVLAVLVLMLNAMRPSRL